jgi:hypothetical protein
MLVPASSKGILSIVLLLVFNMSIAQAQKIEGKKSVFAVYSEETPELDGYLNEACWQKAPASDGFTERTPEPNTPSSMRTEVKVVYTTDAIYVGAMMYDPSPDSILRQLSVRDDINSVNADYFTVYIDGMYTQQSDFSFTVTAAGVRGDASNGDRVWDAAWWSATRITDGGWIVEMEIPYSQLRFPKKEQQVWGINFERSIRRYREKAFWSKIDPEVDGEVQQYGVLLGIEKIKPPIRLSLTPYAAGYLFLEQNGSDLNIRPSATAGTDLKYGINESFTLDVALIPDFGDVQFDDLQFNLSPFEIYYAERRPFFTEGTELFNRADLFYSRRVGNTPTRYWSVESQLDSTETIVRNPDRTQLINALKVSGRTPKGLGVGVFNAVTAPTRALVENTLTEESRLITTEPLANYNMIVLDQQFRNNSYVSFVTSTTTRFGSFTDALVMGTEFRVTDNTNNFAVSGDGAFSHRFLDPELYSEDSESGYKANLDIAKVGGKFRWNLGHSILSDRYNINDLGFLFRNNFMRTNGNISYNVFSPFWIYNNISARVGFYTEQLYRPSKFMRLEFNGNVWGTFKNFLTTGMDFAYQPFGYDDYFEARRAAQVWQKPVWGRIGGFFSSDYRKAFALDGRASYRRFHGETAEWRGADVIEGELEPRFRFSDRVNMIVTQNTTIRRNNIGFVTNATVAGEEAIIFGARYFQTLENRITLNYLFNPQMSLSFSARHYWALVEYSRFYELAEDGSLLLTTYDGEHDRNYNAFNIDLIYRWRFAPGSELNVVWKNAVLSTTDALEYNYFNNFVDMFEDNQLNQFSIKLLYFLDFYKLQPKHKRGRRME